MSAYRTYAELMKMPTQYAKKMNKLSNNIFTEPTRPVVTKSLKVLRLMSERPRNKNPMENSDYYPRHVETGLLMMHLRDYGLYRDEHVDFQEEIKRLRILRGKKQWLPHKEWLKLQK
ncbi:28S ribosomal protein S33, mitochondrial [Nilaparvata lugens]|uniref:28S ribosomal protein S33, mitochondrial n=1 Tax=Nilaparvata lugens TaxID=108931 RepID=UPI000B981675|nr:28S ribosomal protein S33, mitochondrial [Nilaparvata lugens]